MSGGGGWGGGVGGVRNLPKTFDRVWHDGLMYKLKSLGICGNYYGLSHSFLSNRHQRVVLNSQSSNWSQAATTARLVAKFRGYRRVENHTPLTK